MNDTIYSLSRKVKFEESHIAYICKETLKGIAWLHERKRMHRDIKTDNILFNSLGEIKISDFGFSTQLTLEYQIINSVIGTPSWMAPEIILGEGYDSKVDIWALGVLVYELAEGKTPASGNNSIEIMCDITNSPAPEIKGEWSEELISFAKHCLIKQPEKRALANELLNHPVLLQANKEKFLDLIKES